MCAKTVTKKLTKMVTYTTNEVAQILHTSRRTLQMLREEGALEGIKGRSYLYTDDALRQFTELFKGRSFTSRKDVREVMKYGRGS